MKVKWEELVVPLSKMIEVGTNLLLAPVPATLVTTPLPPSPSEYQIQNAGQQQLLDFAKTSPQANDMVSRELSRRQLLVKIRCLKTFLGT
jgi:hypothetical protein